MVSRVGEFISRHSLADSTKALYTSLWAQFQRYSGSLNPPQPTLPASPVLIIDYIRHLTDVLHEPSSKVQSNLSAIAFFHKASGSQPTYHPWVKLVMRDLRKNVSPDTRVPVTPAMLRNIIDACDVVTTSDYKVAMLKALFSTMFHGFLRIGEAAVSKHSLQLADLSIDVNASLTFRSFKHHKTPVTITILANSTDLYCPVKLLTTYLNFRSSKPGYLFCWSDGPGVSFSAFRSFLSRALRAAGILGERVTAHSFRIGAATHAASSGMSPAEIKAIGRWASDAFCKYVRISSLTVSPQ